MAPAEKESEKQELSSATANYEEELQQMIATLPQNSECILPLYNYNGFWISKRFLIGIKLLEINIFSPRLTDVFIASQPKTGTTWLKALAFATLRRKEYHPLTSVPNPLLHLNPHECVLSLESTFSVGLSQSIESLSSPRLFATHILFSMLPASVTASSCRIIYICREPKDTFTSL